MDNDEKIWKKLNTDTDLYKFYLDLLIKSGTYFFLITGAILGWYFSQNNKVLIKYSLILPFIMNFGLIIICSFSIKPVKIMKKEFEETCSKAGFRFVYDMRPLLNVLYLFLCTYLIINAGLVLLFCFGIPSNNS